MREYKICKSDLGRNIYKKREKNGILQVWFLCHNDTRKLDKSYARTFYHREDALSALTVMKVRDGKNAD